MSKVLRILFAWVNPTETTFGPEHYVVDEDVLTLDGEHLEGQKPTLAIEVKNPRIGLLNPGRKIYAWISVDLDGSGVVPVFFGRLVAIPTNIFGEVVTLSFISEAPDWVFRKQAAAEALKTRPRYDPVFLDPTHQDDPDSILEGYSALWHFDRINLNILPSDYLLGEDGEEVFTEDEVPYDNISMTLNQAPSTAVNVKGAVSWIQRASGLMSFGPGVVFSYTGGSIISGWPQRLTSLGGGWRVVASPNAIEMDVYGINRTLNYTGSFSYQNKADEHAIGDTMSIEESFSFPVYGGQTTVVGDTIIQGTSNTGLFGKDAIILTFQYVIGEISEDPDYKDRQPSTAKATFLYVPKWKVNANFTAHYDAKRSRIENLNLTLTSNLQPIITQPTSPTLPVEEIVNVSGIDVGIPFRNILNWASVRNTIVQFGQVIYPANPTIPGGTSFQVCIVGGLTGNGAIPIFSPIVGEITIDNAVTWVSMGSDAGTSVSDWSANTFVPVGQMIRPTSAAWYDYYISQETTDLFGLPIITIGFLPDGNYYFLCTQSGITKLVEDDSPPPTLTGPPGTLIHDGSVIWESLGTGTDAGSLVYIPIARPEARSYFTTDRGRWSLEYLICIARAHLRLRARAVQISFDCEFERAIALSCRKTARLFDRRFPGGEVSGKIISYSFKVDGDKGSFIGHVTIGCAVGYGGTISSSPGTPTYCDIDYVDNYQFMEGEQIVLATGADEVNYTVPLDVQTDDGLNFPLTRRDVIIRDTMHGSLVTQKAAIDKAVELIRRDAVYSGISNLPFNIQQKLAFDAFFSVENELSLRANAIWYELEIKPVEGGPFQNQYNLQTSMLEIPMQIDLGAPSL